MAAKTGRLEATLTVSTALTTSFTSAAGTTIVTIAVGSSYTVSSIISQLNTDLTSIGITVTLSGGESGTGLVTIAAPGQYNLSVTWTSTDLRDLLGFTGNIVAASSAQTGTQHARGLWLPGCPAKYTRHGDGDQGTPVADIRQTVGPRGTVKTLGGEGYREINGLLWEGVPYNRVRSHQETYANESFESFYDDCQRGQWSLGRAGAPVRLVWDADVPGTYVTGTFELPKRFDPETMFRGWVGRYAIAAPRLVIPT